MENTIRHARRLGITSDLPAVPSIALGTANIPLNEMILPYICYANNGTRVTPYYLQEIKDREGRLIYKAPRTGKGRSHIGRGSPVDVLYAFGRHTGRNGKKTNYKLRIKHGDAGKTGTDSKSSGRMVYRLQSADCSVGIRVGANNAQIHFNSIALGQGANMALPIFGLFMQKCLKSNTYAYWEKTSFPMPVLYKKEELEKPIFQRSHEHLGKDCQSKIEKIKRNDTVTPQKEKKGFFRRIGNLFKKKNKN